jgi:hypothetical protein
MVPPIFQHFYALQEKQLEKLNCSVNTAIVLFLDVMEPAPISILMNISIAGKIFMPERCRLSDARVFLCCNTHLQ